MTCGSTCVVYVYVYVYIIYHCGCTALPTRRLDHLIFVVRKTRNPLQLWDAPCSFQRVIHFSCGVEGSPRFLSSRQKRLYISSSCRHRCGTESIVLDLELPQEYHPPCSCCTTPFPHTSTSSCAVAGQSSATRVHCGASHPSYDALCL